LGLVLTNLNRPGDAHDAYASALSIRKQLAVDLPDRPKWRNDVAGTLVNWSVLCVQQREFRKAMTFLQEAMPHHETALKAHHLNKDFRQFYLYNLRVQIRTNAGLGDQKSALEAAGKLRDLGWDPPANAYDAAAGLALCIPIVREDDQATTASRDQLASYYGDAAMAMLRQAVAKGYKDLAHLNGNQDLDSLRGRDDFKQLVAELEAKYQRSS
jgi:hypothetical protein